MLATHGEQRRTYMRAYWERHRERRVAYMREYKARNPEQTARHRRNAYISQKMRQSERLRAARAEGRETT